MCHLQRDLNHYKTVLSAIIYDQTILKKSKTLGFVRLIATEVWVPISPQYCQWTVSYWGPVP